jgi:hypothetical protein
MVKFDRMTRGIQLAREDRIERIFPKRKSCYKVIGKTAVYKVTYDLDTGKYTCNCGDYTHRERYCYHIFGVIAHREDG